MDADAPGESNDQHGEPRRSLEGLDCLGMLRATPANMREACGRRGRPSSGNRQPVATTFHEKEKPPHGGHALESVDSMMWPSFVRLPP